MAIVTLRMSIVVPHCTWVVVARFWSAAMVHGSGHACVESAFRFFSRIVGSSSVYIIWIFAVKILLQLFGAVEIKLLF